MNLKQSVEQGDETQGETNVRARTQTLRGGHDPAALGRLSGERRREKKTRRELYAEKDRLTVQARAAYALASVLTTEQLVKMTEALVSKATDPHSGHVGNSAAQLLFSLRDVVESEGDDTTGVRDFSKLTPKQRAVVRAALDRAALEIEALTEQGEASE
jgi:hypothetical protein